METAGTPLPPGDARLDPAQQGRHQGPDHHADRHRLPLRQRRAARRARALRLPAPVQDLPGRAHAASTTSTWSSSARTPRTSTPASSTSAARPRPTRSSTTSTACRRSRSAPSSGISIKPISEFGSERIIRYAFEYARRQRPQAGPLHPEVQHHEVHRRPVPVGVPRGGQGLPGHRAVGEPGRRDLHGPRAAARRVGRARAAQPLRRHPVRPHRRHGRRSRRRAGRQHRHRHRGLRGDARLARRSTRARTRSTRPR